MARTVWFLAYLLGTYGVAWAGFHFLGLDQLASRASAWLATFVLDLATPSAVTLASDGGEVVFMLDSGQKVSHDIRIAGQTVPLLFAVVFAIAQSLGWRTFALLGGGLVAILLLDGLTLTGQVWTEFGDALPRNGAYHLLRIFSIWNEGGWSFLPVFVAALLAANMPGGTGMVGLRKTE
ncbi:MAG: hypothetical protein GY733_09200 [bacterium]|nr:hypothetical protein [bacterium]